MGAVESLALTSHPEPRIRRRAEASRAPLTPEVVDAPPLDPSPSERQDRRFTDRLRLGGALGHDVFAGQGLLRGAAVGRGVRLKRRDLAD